MVLLPDGDHSYFREGTLLTTCAFNSVLMAWVPVLYTWAAGDKFNSKFLLNVFDFSSSQHSAYAEEYAATLRDLMPNWSTLVSSAQQAQYQAWLDEASNHQVSCETHFYRSGTRLRKDPNLVPPAEQDHFDNLQRQMVSNEITEAQFNNLISSFHHSFKPLRTWINWWTRPVIASYDLSG
ncbi:hypothetical protein QCA50_007967 [Cerrena zonata]|uniref:Uncharacterized protein n=1 Tax=Cerrena zonata TaxID=2478898 RepID=A0AAW0G935_9APHY